MKISLRGPYPPPYGGISIYVQRLERRLREKKIGCVVYDTSGLKKNYKDIDIKRGRGLLLKFLFAPDENIIHIQCSGYDSKMLIGIMALALLRKALFQKKEIMITYHSWRKEICSMNSLEKLLMRSVSTFVECFIAVGPHIKKKLINLGINPKNIEVIPAFITPSVKEEDIKEIPDDIWSFIDSHNPIISANAFKICFHNNQDLYGLDMCIDLSTTLKKDYPQLGFIFCLPAIGDYEYFNKMKQKIKEKGIEANFLFQTKPCQMYPLIMKSNVFVRPTNTDGDSVSLRESLHFNVPALASDVCLRPEGTILFRNRDIKDFAAKMKEVLDNYDQYKKKLEETKTEDNCKRIIDIYRKLNNK